MSTAAPAFAPVETEHDDPRNIELLDCAIDIFLDKGFERTTIDEIAAAAAMAKRSVYARYKDKTALFQAALQRAIDNWRVTEEQLRACETSDLALTLQGVARILVASVQSRQGLRLVRMTNTESSRMPEIGAYTYRRGSQPTIAYLSELFHRRLGHDHGGRDDVEDAALLFLTLCMGGPARMTSWGEDMDSDAIEEHADYCVELFLGGVLPR